MPVKNRMWTVLGFDILFLFIAFLLMAAYKPSTANYLDIQYFIGFSVLLGSWIFSGIYFKKYIYKKKNSLPRIIRRILASNIMATSFVALIILSFDISGYSRTVFFGTVSITTLANLIFGNLYFYLLHTRNGATDIINPPPRAQDIRRIQKSINYRDITLSDSVIREAIIDECGLEAARFIERHVDLADPRSLCISTTTRFNVEFQPNDYFNRIINLKRINDLQYINKFFETVNRKLPDGGLFLGCVETKDERKKRILRKYPPVINWIYYTFDFLLKRVFPKFILTKKIYFFLTRGNNRVMSKAEVLGRLYSCGFEELDEREIDNLYFFVMKKIKEPAYDFNPTYGPFVKLKRIGKGGKIINVYKFRTMHPYAEYLQDYVFRKNHLKEGGKFNNDFRINMLGKIMRKLWIDELPMLINIVRGDLKIVGVRPLSRHYFSLYSDEMKEMRTCCKPGLIPPFYADLPKTLEEIQESERRYLEAYQKHPLLTDWRYFWKAMNNIFIRRARSG